MPRNRSEVLPRNPQAHAYARAIKAYYAGRTMERKRAMIASFSRINHTAARQILRSCPGDDKRGRMARVQFIRKHYAP